MPHRFAAMLVASAMAWALAPGPAAAACPNMVEVARLAGAMVDRRAPPPPRTDMTPDDALCARDRLVMVLSQPWGDQVGWKVAPGSPPMAGALFFGTLRERAEETFRPGTHPSIPAQFGTAPMAAPGLLLRVADEGVNEVGGDQLGLLRSLDAVIPFLDLPDLVHGPDAPWSRELLLSLNLSTRLGVLGEPIATAATPEFARALGAASVSLAVDGREVARGSGADAVGGHPLAALAWLVRDLKDQGRRLRMGEHVAVVLAPSVPAAAGRLYEVSLAGMSSQVASVGARLE